MENYQLLLSTLIDHEKYTLIEYADNDDNKLVFFNPNNVELCMKLTKLVINKIFKFRKRELKIRL